MNERSGRSASSNLHLPPPPKPRGLYSSVVIHGGIAYVSGQVSRVSDNVIKGPVRSDTCPDDIRRAAHACILNALSVLDQALDDLNRLDRFLFLRGFVAAAPDFTEHSKVLEPASEMLIAAFGDSGRHARSAIGVCSLPSGGLLEVELVAALKR